LALILFLASQGAGAFRCDGYLIDAGQSQFEVKGKCGDPQGSERRTVWRLLTTFQEQCQTVMQPAPPPSPIPNRPPAVSVTIPKTICTPVPISYTVPVDEEIWYFEDNPVPKALHFENGRLVWVETLWRLRQ
jgi:hypothetical protein